MASFSSYFLSSQLVTEPTYQVDKWPLSPGGPVAARSKCTAGVNPAGPALLSVCWGVQRVRGEAYPLTPWVSYCLSDPCASYRLWGLGSGQTAQTAPVAAEAEAASSVASRWVSAAGACGGSMGTGDGGARTNSGRPTVAETG